MALLTCREPEGKLGVGDLLQSRGFPQHGKEPQTTAELSEEELLCVSSSSPDISRLKKTSRCATSVFSKICQCCTLRKKYSNDPGPGWSEMLTAYLYGVTSYQEKCCSFYTLKSAVFYFYIINCWVFFYCYVLKPDGFSFLHLRNCCFFQLHLKNCYFQIFIS